mgnify:FL=1
MDKGLLRRVVRRKQLRRATAPAYDRARVDDLRETISKLLRGFETLSEQAACDFGHRRTRSDGQILNGIGLVDIDVEPNALFQEGRDHGCVFVFWDVLRGERCLH